MDGTIYCLVDARGNVYSKDGADSHSSVAAEFGLNERECHCYRFDLTSRRLVADRATPSTNVAARTYLDQRVGTPEKLMAFAEEGHLPKSALVTLLNIENRRPYLEACAAIEKRYTEQCTAKDEPCLESGCALEGETCLQPLLEAGIEYQKACAAEWVGRFQNPQKRIDIWRN